MRTVRNQNGRDGIRTRDVLVRNQELYPLSYAPTEQEREVGGLGVVIAQGVSFVSSVMSDVG
jgi:hypothetical protein